MGFFDGVVETVRLSQRFCRFEGVVVGVSAVVVDPGLGKYVRSKTPRARLFFLAMRPTTFAVILKKESDEISIRKRRSEII